METKKSIKQNFKIKNNYLKGTTMKTSFALLFGVVCLLILLIPLSAYAAGTPYGTVITNQAKAAYKNAGGTQMDTVLSNITSTTVDKKPGITITPTTRSVVAADSSYVTYAAQITNNGNYTDAFNVGAVSQLFNGSVQIYKDVNRDGILQPGEITSTIALTDSALADSSVWVIIRIFTTNGTVSGTKDTTTLTADPSQFTSTTATQKNALLISRTTFGTATKTATPNNAQPGVGNNFTYSIKFLNTGTSNADTVKIVDVLPSNITWVASSADSGGTVTHTATSPDSVYFKTLAIPAGRGAGFQITAYIVAGTVAGTIINNSVLMTYTDSVGGFHRTAGAGPTPVTVNEKLGWTLNIDTVSGGLTNHNVTDSTQSGVQMEYVLRLTNNANRTDTAVVTWFDTTVTNWTTKAVYWDKDANGTYSSSLDSIVTSGYTTKPVAQNGTVYFFAIATPGTHVADRTLDSAFYKAKSIAHTFADSVWSKLTVLAPIMNVSKTVNKVHGTARPGDTLEYVVNYYNTGSGSAQSIFITDLVPTHTSFVSGSGYYSNDGVTYSTQVSDASLGNPQNTPYMVTYNAGALTQGKWGAPLASKGYLKFRVVIL